jgi:hypothetical protein
MRPKSNRGRHVTMLDWSDLTWLSWEVPYRKFSHFGPTNIVFFFLFQLIRITIFKYRATLNCYATCIIVTFYHFVVQSALVLSYHTVRTSKEKLFTLWSLLFPTLTSYGTCASWSFACDRTGHLKRKRREYIWQCLRGRDVPNPTRRIKSVLQKEYTSCKTNSYGAPTVAYGVKEL